MCQYCKSHPKKKKNYMLKTLRKNGRVDLNVKLISLNGETDLKKKK